MYIHMYIYIYTYIHTYKIPPMMLRLRKKYWKIPHFRALHLPLFTSNNGVNMSIADMKLTKST